MPMYSTPDVVCELTSAKTIRLFREKSFIQNAQGLRAFCINGFSPKNLIVFAEISSHTTSGDCAISRHIIQTKAVHRRTTAHLNDHKSKEMAINRTRKPHKIYGNNDTLKAR